MKRSNWIKGILAGSIETAAVHYSVKNKKHQRRGLEKRGTEKTHGRTGANEI